MSELLQNYNAYGNFLRENYFVQTYNDIPSKFFLELPLEATKDNMEAVMKKIDIADNDLELVFKTWINSSSKKKEEEGFPAQNFYKSKAKELCFWVSLEHERLFIEILYQETDQALEKWILALGQDLRMTFGKQKNPVFKVLSKGGSDYYTEDIDISEVILEIDKLYNDDFAPIHAVIGESLAVDSSGLILLHGPPGTGKTSYIKGLLSKHENRNFIFIPNNFVNELLQPGFISFLITNKNSILVIEDAEKVIISRESNTQNSVVSTILQLTDGLFSDFLNIKIICTFNTSIDKVDKALLRKGRMIAYYEFKALSATKSNALVTSLGYEAGDEEMTLADIFNLDKKDFERQKKLNAIGFLK